MRRFAGVVALLFVTGFVLWSWAGNLEPPGPPGPTMVTLEEIFAKLDEPVDVCFDNVGRFVVCGDGAVKDNLTGLFWLENANCFGIQTWAGASIAAAQLGDGQCGLTDGSSPGDWRLPTQAEWQTIVDQANTNGCGAPTFPDTSGIGCCGVFPCAFAGVQSANYWSSTTNASGPHSAWNPSLNVGNLFSIFKANIIFVWPVRAGQ